MITRAALALSLLAAPVSAHDGVVHATPEDAAAHQAPALPFPVEITPRFDLVDQTGRRWTEADLDGPALLFFGYATCEAICSVALPAIAETLALLGDEATAVQPLMITVDPERDTPEAMGHALAKWDDRLVGLTGSEAALSGAREAFQVEVKEVATLPDGSPVYAHGSFVYLITGGRVAAVLPPILSAERMARIIRSHL